MFAILNSLIARSRFLVPVCLSVSLAFGMAWVADANTTFIVTTTADNGDNANPTPGSLRAAIINANNTPGPDKISFSIGSGLQTIQPLTQLPNLSDAVIIDGTTQPGFAGSPLIEIDGSLTTNSAGLVVTSNASSTIRGLVINRFAANGVVLAGNGSHLVAGNYIGTNAAGTAGFPIPNNGVGISVMTANNIIGGTTEADRNVISGNRVQSGSIGIDVFGGGNKILGNYIGTDVTGTASLGHTNSGVRLGSAGSNVLGGATIAERNVISGNFLGVNVVQSQNNKVQGNYIGATPNGSGGLSGTYGIYIESGSKNNLVGGANPGEGNLIPSSVNRGVVVVVDTSFNNAILGNFISASSIAIDLKSDGVTPNDYGLTINDPSDADTGPNNLQNFPVLSSVMPDGNNTVIEGTLRSEASKTYRIELFSNTSCNGSGFGGARFFVAATNANTNASGNASFSFTIPTASITGAVFAATATDPANNTSELSQCKSAGPPAAGTIQFGTSSLSVNESTGQAVVTVTRAGGSAGAVSVHYATSDGDAPTADPVSDYTAKSAQLDFANGESTRNIIIDLTNDSFSEPTEDFYITLSSPTGGAALGTQKVVKVVIVDDDAPKISINDVQVAEGNSGTTNATFTISLNRAYFNVVTVDYVTDIGGAATSGIDYQPTGGTVTFNIGETSKPATVLINGDTSPEPNENFFVKLSNNSAVGISDFTGLGTILDDDNPGASTVQFNQSNYNAQESLSALTITVTRTGDTSGAASVNYGSTDGTATQKGDFELVLGTLNFAPGDATRTFQVLVNEDMYAEGAESFTLSLSSPSGAALGQPSTAAVTLNDDAAESLTNPIDESQSFIHMQYHDFLGREPEPEGMQFYLDILNGCQPGDTECIKYTRGALSANFFRSPEFQAKGSYVMYLYMVSIGQRPVTATELPTHNDPSRNDRPHYAEFMADVQTITSPDDRNGPDPAKKAALTAAWVQRPEIIALYPANLTNAQFAQSLANTAGVTLSASTQSAVAAALTRAEILSIIVESPEVNAKFYQQAFVTMQYFGYLRRDPEDCHDSQNWWGTGDPNACGYIFHNNRFQLVADPDFLENTIVRGFIESPEYRQRFGQ
jgi:hypothetical protein